MYLLRTERPKLLPRERETHEWYDRERPWEKFPNLHQVYDNAPGDWRHYSRVFHQTWKRAAKENQGLINSESDVVPTLEAFRQVIECQEYVCMIPYVIYTYNTGTVIGHSATVETRVPGGWDSHFANPGDEWASGGDLGFVRFSDGLVPAFNVDEVPELEYDNGLLNEAVYRWLQRRLNRHSFIHLHWPDGKGLVNYHRYWDVGDDAHDGVRRVPAGKWSLDPSEVAAYY
jgi:hypothetical protein